MPLNLKEIRDRVRHSGNRGVRLFDLSHTGTRLREAFSGRSGFHTYTAPGHAESKYATRRRRGRVYFSRTH